MDEKAMAVSSTYMRYAHLDLDTCRDGFAEMACGVCMCTPTTVTKARGKKKLEIRYRVGAERKNNGCPKRRYQGGDKEE